MPLSTVPAPSRSAPPVCDSSRPNPDSDLARAARNARARAPTLPLPGGGDTLSRWRALAALAAADVCLAKVMEAHYDAQAILHELQAPVPADSGLYAVWAAEPPDARLAFVEDEGAGGAGQLHGVKAWCSGAGLVDRALVTAHAGTHRVLVEVDMAQATVCPAGGDWHAVGMARVHSGRVTFDGARCTRVGVPGAYLERPGFWHGGAGIAACWFGAASAIAEPLRRHPRAARDPHAAAHLGAIDVALCAAAAVLRETAALVDAAPGSPHVEAVMRARALIERVATGVIDRVGRALGPAPLCEDAAHARRCADLAVFIRQSHAERDWAVIGHAAGAGAGWTL